MTPQEILELSEPLEAVYTDTVAQLIANICKRLGEGKELPNWQAKKLAELDALTDESIQIISRMTGRRDTEIRNAIAKALNIELKDVEAVLTGAAAAGAIAGIGFTVEESQGLKSMAQALIDQAETRANLVNTVMLNSTRQRYIWAVNSTADREQKLIEQLYSARNYEELEAQLSKVQAALNKAAGAVEVGAEARVQALSRTVKELAQEGITGYIDRGGHHWSPEAYMNMDIRTTVHNTAVQAQKTRAEEYGVETFQISSHGGARPLCAPYQGKFYSWDGSSGVVHDLRGNEYIYESIYDTSYGEPAGIFGINCGHNPQTFVDGYNIPRYEETSDFEANAEEYRESQKQRYFEREVRQAKLEAIAQDAAGNKDAFDKAAAKVRQANANYKEFCKSTGRTPRPDRLQVYTSETGTGYNRHMSGRVTGTTKGFKPTPLKPQTQEKPKQDLYSFTQPQKDAIEWYVSGEGQFVNQIMRGRSSERFTDYEKEQVEILKEATNRPLPSGIKELYRSVDASAVFGDMSLSDFDNMQSLLMYDADDRYAQAQKKRVESIIDKTITEKGFMSTTKDKETALYWGDFTGSEKPIALSLKVRDGIKGADLKDFDVEGSEQQEVLLHPNTKYKVKRVGVEEGTIVVYADLIP
jgi:hypothetical protein